MIAESVGGKERRGHQISSTERGRQRHFGEGEGRCGLRFRDEHRLKWFSPQRKDLLVVRLMWSLGLTILSRRAIGTNTNN